MRNKPEFYKYHQISEDFSLHNCGDNCDKKIFCFLTVVVYHYKKFHINKGFFFGNIKILNLSSETLCFWENITISALLSDNSCLSFELY